MKNMYLVLAIVGFVAPNILVVAESIETGNIMLYANPAATFESMFANRISSIFAIDLLLAVVVFFVWSFNDAKKEGVKNIYIIWMLTMLLGLAGGFPLYLYKRELSKTAN